MVSLVWGGLFVEAEHPGWGGLLFVLSKPKQPDLEYSGGVHHGKLAKTVAKAEAWLPEEPYYMLSAMRRTNDAKTKVPLLAKNETPQK